MRQGEKIKIVPWLLGPSTEVPLLGQETQPSKSWFSFCLVAV